MSKGAMAPRWGSIQRHEQPSLGYEIVTPEGIPLRFALAGAGDRAAAFLIDLLAIVGITLGIVLLLALATLGNLGDSWLGAIAILALFLVRSFYFVWFEMRWQGTTPGKRRLGIRVIDRNGGHLKGDAIFARNLMREIEFFVPLAGLAAPETLYPGATGLYYLIVSVWLLVFVFMPLFNKERLRIGDMVAGTVVVYTPRAVLLTDLSKSSTREADAVAVSPYFTTEQLDIYGIYELQVLEDLLRQRDQVDLMTIEAVCRKIKEKIGWQEDQWGADSMTFLREFYAAQRARLEHKMLLGKRQEQKRWTARLRAITKRRPD